jgi:adenylosuccinate synthase
MSVSVVVGGQYGSEGKGKVAHFLAQHRAAAAVVRVGGSNSGHTAVAAGGDHVILRQLPTASLLPNVLCVLAPGSYVDPELLIEECDRVSLDPERLMIDPNAVVIDDQDRDEEGRSDLRARIGSTCSGTGAAVRKRIDRLSRSHLASECPKLKPFVRDTLSEVRHLLDLQERVIIEGTQGFGLSVLHSPQYPNVTSRDTTAAGALSEAGLSPLDVDEVVLVLRAFPIRVAGNSGPLPNEIDWDTVTREGNHKKQIIEQTSVTRLTRRVGRFDPEIVRRAIDANRPSNIVLNHVDYVDFHVGERDTLTPRAEAFISWVEGEIRHSVTWLGFGPNSLHARAGDRVLAAA